MDGRRQPPPPSRTSVTSRSSLSRSEMTLCRHGAAPVRFYIKATSGVRAQPRCWVHVTGGAADAAATPAFRKEGFMVVEGECLSSSQ